MTIPEGARSLAMAGSVFRWLGPVFVVTFGVADAIIGQIQSQTLKQYNFMKTAMNCVMYFVVYYGILLIRVRTGAVPRRHLHFMYAAKLNPPMPSEDNETVATCWEQSGMWKYLLIAGTCDLINEFMGFTAQPYLRGVLVKLLGQCTTIFVLILTIVFLKQRFAMIQYAGIALAILGATAGAWGSNWETSSLWYALLYAASALPSALSFVLKERAFREYDRWREVSNTGVQEGSSNDRGRDLLDVFVVCSAAALFQLLSGPIVLPLSSELTNKAHIPLDKWWREAWSCFQGIVPERLSAAELSQAPYLCKQPWQWYLLYAASNAGLNISVYYTILHGSSLLFFLAAKLITPISALFFLIDWPIIGSQAINHIQLLSLGLTLSGLLLFKFKQPGQSISPSQASSGIYLQDVSTDGHARTT